MDINIRFDRGYIAHPYWPAVEQVVSIEKESGTRRARNEQNRIKALSDYLALIPMTLDEFEALKAKAARPFYLLSDLGADPLEPAPKANGHSADEIVIPPHQIRGMLAQASDLARSSIRVARRDQVRSVFTVQPIFTGKRRHDGVWERYAVVTSGTGAKLSNQRALRRNAYLGPFGSTLTIEWDERFYPTAKVLEFIGWAGREVGIGAARKLGWGRFRIE